MASSASASAPAPFLTARSMLSAGMLYSRALSIAARKVGEVMSPFVCLDAVEISLAIFEKIFDLVASVTAFLFLIFDHLLCPLIPLEIGRVNASAVICHLMIISHTRSLTGLIAISFGDWPEEFCQGVCKRVRSGRDHGRCVQ